MYTHGRDAALFHLGFVKTADPFNALLRRAVRHGTSVAPRKTSLLTTLFGEPQRLLNPIKLIKEVASLETIRNAARTLQTPHAGLWNKTKATGAIAGDVLNKTFLLGLPSYGIYRGLTTTPLPGETKSEAVGRTIGESLGWMPPSGIVGLGTSIFTPDYSLPGLLARAGGAAGAGVGKLLGEQPTPYPAEEEVVLPAQYNP